jgi:hypothetical protein
MIILSITYFVPLPSVVYLWKFLGAKKFLEISRSLAILTLLRGQVFKYRLKYVINYW